MRRIRDLARLSQSTFRQPVVTIGVFDGVHQGHQAILETVTSWSGGGESVVVTFDPHPREVLEGEEVRLIVSLEHRLRLLEKEGIETTVVIPFDREMASMSADRFLEDVLLEQIGTRRIVLGENGGFGRDRVGTPDYLQRRESELGYESRIVRLERKGGQTVSSTAIRNGIREGDLNEVERLLGRPYSIVAPVVRGDGRGRTIGFPTANLDTGGLLLLPRGVYGARVTLPEATHPALVNIGRRPTFTRDDRDRVEVHLLDFDGELYDRTLEVTFLCRIRNERTFSGPEELVAQIERDREAFLQRLRQEVQ